MCVSVCVRVFACLCVREEGKRRRKGKAGCYFFVALCCSVVLGTVNTNASVSQEFGTQNCQES